MNRRIMILFFSVGIVFCLWFVVDSYAEIKQQSSFVFESDFVEISDTMTECSQSSGDGYYYFTVEQYDSLEFRILDVSFFDFSNLKQAMGSKVTFYVEKNKFKNHTNEEVINVYAFYGNEECMFTFDEYINRQRTINIICMVIGFLVTAGGIFGLFFYIRAPK